MKKKWNQASYPILPIKAPHLVAPLLIQSATRDELASHGECFTVPDNPNNHRPPGVRYGCPCISPESRLQVNRSTRSSSLYIHILLLGIAGARPQVQPGRHCVRSNLSQSGQRCTPNDACHAICDKLKGSDGKCEDGACMCTFCSPYIPSKRPIGSKGRGWSIRLAAGLLHASIFVSSHACIVWSCNEDLCRPSLMLNNQCNMQLVIYTVFYIADYILFHQSPPIPDRFYIYKFGFGKTLINKL